MRCPHPCDPFDRALRGIGTETRQTDVCPMKSRILILGRRHLALALALPFSSFQPLLQLGYLRGEISTRPAADATG